MAMGLWSRLLDLFGVHRMEVVMDDGDTVIARFQWCCATTAGVSPRWRED